MTKRDTVDLGHQSQHMRGVSQMNRYLDFILGQSSCMGAWSMVSERFAGWVNFIDLLHYILSN
jgi:hypothetical protein